MTIEKVGIVGAGTMGNGIAQVFAMAGYDVVMRDIKEEFVARGVSTINKNLDRMVSRNKLSSDDKEATLARIKTTIDLGPFADRDLIIEAALEEVSIKLQLFRELDEVAKADAILATNTSSISVTKIAAATKRPGQVIGMHFFNPVPVMQLVEVVRALQTSEEVVKVVEETSHAIKKLHMSLKIALGLWSIEFSSRW